MKNKMKRNIFKFLPILILIIILISTNVIVTRISSNNIINNQKKAAIKSNQGPFEEKDFLKTNGTKIINQDNEEIILRGYNLGLWLSKSFWGLPVSMQYNESDTERYSPVNSIEMDYELFNNPNLTQEQVEELNNLFYSNQITKDDIQTIAKTGANLVRVPIEWTFFMRPEYNKSYSGDVKNNADYNNYGALAYIDTTLDTASDEDKEFLNKRLEYLNWIVNECNTRRIYVIFDLHVAPGGLNAGGNREAPLFFEKGEEGKNRRECALRIWKIISEQFKNNPTVAGYDIVNEPACFNQGKSEKYIDVIDFYDEAYKLIRNVEKECENKHIVIMEEKVKSYSNSNISITMDKEHGGLPNPSEKGWENVVYSRHDYFYNFRNAEEDLGKDAEWQKDNPDIDVMKARIDNSIKETKYTMEEYNIPVWVGESSCHAYYNDSEGNVVGTFQDSEGNRFSLNKEYTEEIWNHQIQSYEANNISYTTWTYKACWENYFGLVYYGRKSGVNRINLRTATYEEIANVFGGNSSDIMNYNKNFHNIFKKQLQIFAGVDISSQGDGSIIATLSNDKTTLTITGAGEMTDFSSVDIEECENYQYDKETVSPWYEYRKNITTVEISENITNIGQDTFLNCSNLKNITIPNTATKIGEYAFHNCSEIENIKIPNSVTNINMGAFYKCNKLEWIELGNGVSYIGKEAFTGCSALQNIYVYASNQNYTAIDGVLCNKEKTKIIKYPEGKENEECIISSNITSIEDGAFYGTTLTKIIIPKQVKDIGNNAFTESKNLTIICSAGSKIEEYSIKNEIPYILDEGFPQITFTTNGTNKTVKSASTKVVVKDTDTKNATGIDTTNLKYHWETKKEGVSALEIVTSFSEDEIITTPQQEGTYYLWILARDKVGNEKIQVSNAFYIDAIPPTVSISFQNERTVMVTSNEKIQELEGWQLSEDKLVLTKIYNSNATEVITIKDLVGNETNVTISITDIKDEEEKPGTGNEEEKPGTGNEEEKPGTGDEEEKPGTGDEEEKPGTGDEEEKPGTGNEEEKPGTGDEEEKPGTGNEEEKPGTGNEEEKPGTGDKDNTTANTDIPQTGLDIKLILLMIIAIINAVIMYIKYKKHRDIV